MTKDKNFLEQRVDDLKGHRQAAALDEIEVEFANVRAAWRQAVKRKNYVAIGSMIEGLYWYCWLHGRFTDAENLFSLARDELAPLPGETPHPVWARVVARYPGENARENIERSLAIAKAEDNPTEVAWCTRMLGRVVSYQEGRQAALPFFEKCVAMFRDQEDLFHLSRALGDLGTTYQMIGDLDRAVPLQQEALTLCEEIGDQIGVASRALGLGISAFIIGDYESARHHWQMVAAQAAPNMQTVSGAFLGLLDLLDGNPIQARRLAQDSIAMARKIGDTDSVSVAAVVLGMCLVLDGDCAAATTMIEDTHIVRAAQVFSNWVLAAAACGHQEKSLVRRYTYLGLKQAMQFNSPAWKLLFLPAYAMIVSDRERALELLGLVHTHKAAATGWLRAWTVLTEFNQTLKGELGDDAYNAAWERGKAHDIHDLVREIYEKLDDDPDLQID